MKKALIALAFPLVAYAQTAEINPKYGPYPASASPVKTSKASSFCGRTEPDGGYASAWMTPADCEKWMGAHSGVTKMQACKTEGLAYTVAIQGRDFGLTPQQSLSRMQGMTAQGVSEGFLKAVINSVYFNPSFANAHGDSVQYDATAACMHPDSATQPLR